MFKFAENILNNLDQTTQSSIQTALKKSDDHKKNDKKYVKTTKMNASQSEANLTPTNSYNNTQNMDYKNTNNKISHPNMKEWQNVTKTIDKDDELMNFLNSDDSIQTNDAIKFEIGDSPRSKRSKTPQSIETQSEGHSEEHDQDIDEITTLDSGDNKIEDYKKEIISLSKEIKSLNRRIKESEIDYKNNRRKIDIYQNQISESDRIIRELRSREEDMTESIRSKDSQLAVIRIRFDEVDTALKKKQLEIEEIKQKSQEMIQDKTNSTDIQSQAFETLKLKLEEMEKSLKDEKDAFEQSQAQHMSLQNRLEMEKQDLSESLNAIERKYSEERARNNEINSKFKIN
jgi:chromosome segregation ATPase